jgi:phospholipase/carboxylesterase
MAADLPLEHVVIEPRSDGQDRAPSPAVVVLHGRGADERDLLPVAQRFPDDLFVLSLRAPDRLMGGYTWYDLDLSGGGLESSQPNSKEFARSRELVRESIERAIESYELDPDRIGVVGFSQGAITSLALLLDSPKKYAWVAGLHGYLAASHTDREPAGIEDKPVFLAGGTADEVIPAGRVERAAKRLEEIGCTVTHGTYGSAHGIGPDELDDLLAWVDRRAPR